MTAHRILLLGLAVGALAAGPAFADRHGDRGHHYGQLLHSTGGTYVGAPGPVAGVGFGLPLIAALGGYVWLQRRNRRSKSVG